MAMGGGFANTELRILIRCHVYLNFLILLHWMMAKHRLKYLIAHIEGKKSTEELKRTFTLVDNEGCLYQQQSLHRL